MGICTGALCIQLFVFDLCISSADVTAVAAMLSAHCSISDPAGAAVSPSQPELQTAQMFSIRITPTVDLLVIEYSC